MVSAGCVHGGGSQHLQDSWQQDRGESKAGNDRSLPEGHRSGSKRPMGHASQAGPGAAPTIDRRHRDQSRQQEKETVIPEPQAPAALPEDGLVSAGPFFYLAVGEGAGDFRTAKRPGKNQHRRRQKNGGEGKQDQKLVYEGEDTRTVEKRAAHGVHRVGYGIQVRYDLQPWRQNTHRE